MAARDYHLSLGSSKSEHAGGFHGVPRSYSQRAAGAPPHRGTPRNNSGISTDSSLSSGSYHGGSQLSTFSNHGQSMRSMHSNNTNNSSQRVINNNYGKRSAPRRHQSMGILSNSHSTSNPNNNSFQNKSFRKPILNRCGSGDSFDGLGKNSGHSSRSINAGCFQHSYKKPVMPGKQQYLAMDCEMVGTVSGKSVAARVVLIDWKGRPVFDKHMKPEEPVTDYRTFVSGITEDDLKDALPFAEVVEEVKEMLKDKILVGHGLDNDLRSLGVDHAWLMMRDTAYYQPFMRQLETSTFNNHAMSQANGGQPVWGPRKLKDLAKEKLGHDIQVPGKSHCPIEDAAAALNLYKSHRPRWEACMSTEERQQKHRQAYEAAVLAYEQYHAQMAAFGAPSRSGSSDDLSSVSMHSYFPPTQSVVTEATSQLNSNAALHTGYQHHGPTGLSRQPSFDGNSYQPPHGLHGGTSSMSLDAHSYHGMGTFQHHHNLHPKPQQQNQNQRSASSRRLYERTTNLTPNQIQRQLSLG